MVSFSERAHAVMLKRMGHFEVCITWDELRALAAGVDDVQGAEKHARLMQALQFFADRQKLPWASFL
jgi:hypothetical protein